MRNVEISRMEYQKRLFPKEDILLQQIFAEGLKEAWKVLFRKCQVSLSHFHVRFKFHRFEIPPAAFRHRRIQRPIKISRNKIVSMRWN